MGGRIAGFLVMLVTASAAGHGYGDEPKHATLSPQQQALADLGLKAMGPTYVLDAEADIRKQAAEAKLLSKQWHAALLQQQETASPKDQQAMIQQMTAQVGQLRNELNLVNRQIQGTPRGRGRYARYWTSPEVSELSAYKNELNATMAEQNAMIAQMKGHPIDPRQKQKIDSDARDLHDRFERAVRDLDRLVTTSKGRYAELAKDGAVKKALADIDPAIKPRPQLGPSREFHETIKLLDRFEKDLRRASAAAPASPFDDASGSGTAGKKAGGARRDRLNSPR